MSSSSPLRSSFRGGHKIPLKWTREEVLREARKRTTALSIENSKRIAEMLRELMSLSGFTEEEFIDILCEDTIRRGFH